MRSFLVLVLVLATSALAVKPGDHLYVKTKDTRLRKDPNLKAKVILTLQPGKAVSWNGVSVTAKDWHEVTVDGKKGYVHRSELTPQQPMSEVAGSTGTPVDPQAFAASGPTKCSFEPVRDSNKSPAQKEAMAELIYLEELNREKASGAALDQKNQELHR